VALPDLLAEAIEATLPPREDRDLEAPLFPEEGRLPDRLHSARRARGPAVSLDPLNWTTRRSYSKSGCVARRQTDERRGELREGRDRLWKRRASDG